MTNNNTSSNCSSPPVSEPEKAAIAIRDDDVIAPTTEEALDVIVPNCIRLRFYLAAQFFHVSDNPLIDTIIANLIMRDADDIYCTLLHWLPYYGEEHQRWGQQFVNLLKVTNEKARHSFINSIQDAAMRNLFRMGMKAWQLTLIEEAVEDGHDPQKLMTQAVYRQMDTTLVSFLTTWGDNTCLWGWQWDCADRMSSGAVANDEDAGEEKVVTGEFAI